MRNTKLLAIGLSILFCVTSIFYARGSCDASFSFAALNYNQYQFISNQQQQSGYTYYHTWTGAGNTQPHTPSITAYFSTAGNKDICHIITEQDSLGNVLCTDTQCQVVTVVFPNNCIPNFYINSDIDVPMSVSFGSSIINYTNLSLSWSFGDGQISTGTAAPNHTYALPGIYRVCLYVNDTVQHCIDSACNNISVDTTIHCSLYAYFNSRQQSFLVPEAKFTTNNTSADITYSWNFGDGTHSTLPEVNHVYPAFGAYYVCLTITDTVTGCTDDYCNAITLDTCDADIAEFSAYMGSGSGVVVLNTFTDNYLYGTDIDPVSSLWSFGDGTFDNTHLSTTHAYPALGEYYCCYYVNVPGCANNSSCDTVVVSCQINAYFSSTTVNSLQQLFTYYTGSSNQNMEYSWTFGDGAVGTDNYPLHIYTQQGFYNVCLIATDTLLGCSDTTCQAVLVSPWTDTICGFVFADNNLNGIQDGGELSMAGVTINAGSNLHTETDSAGYYEMVVPKDQPIYITTSFPAAFLFTLPFGVEYYQDTFFNPNERHCGFDFGIVTNSVTVRGLVFGDYNQDGMRNWNDPMLPNQMVKAGNQLVPTDGYGSYSCVVPIGTTVVELYQQGAFAGYPVLPAQWPILAASPGDFFNGKNFGIGIDSGTHDVAVNLIPTSPVSTLNDPTYQLLVSNLGSATAYLETGIISDNALTFDNILYGSDANNPATHTTSWFEVLYPFQQKLIPAGYNAATSLVLNQNIYNTAFVQMMIDTDANTANNTHVSHQIVVGSFDPNNKISDNAGVGLQGYIANGTELTYTINFQNTGTADAVNIIVTDVLSSQLDLSSFRFLGSSHRCDVRITGDTVYFRFSKIMLPDSLHNEPASHGWVSFAINPKPNLAAETQIFNSAAIYFDHNEPVLTNTTLHTIDVALAIRNLATDGKQLVAYPNPFGKATTVFLKDFPEDNFNYAVFDLLGRKVATGTISNVKPVLLDSGIFNAGTYLFCVFDDTGVAARILLVAE